MGRQEKPIRDDAPAKELAKRLRLLRRQAGSPGYRELGELVHCTHHALSQSVDGRYVTWHVVERFIRALRLYQPDLITDDVTAELAQLHDQAMAAHSQRKKAPKAKIATDSEEVTRERDRVAIETFWELVDQAHDSSIRQAAADRAPGQWHVTYLGQISGRLEWIINTRDLVTALNQILAGRSRMHAQAQAGLGCFGVSQEVYREYGVSRPTPEQIDEWRVLNGSLPPTLPVVLRIIRAHGGTDGDCLAWQSAWERVRSNQPSPPPARYAPPPSPFDGPTLEMPTIPRQQDRRNEGLLRRLTQRIRKT